MPQEKKKEKGRAKKKTGAKGKAATTGAAQNESVQQAIERALRTKFKTDTVDVSPGFEENIHIVVVSRLFDDKSDEERFKMITDLIDRHTDLDDDDKYKITLLMTYSPEEFK